MPERPDVEGCKRVLATNARRKSLTVSKVGGRSAIAARVARDADGSVRRLLRTA
jgi:hypothetical protein